MILLALILFGILCQSCEPTGTPTRVIANYPDTTSIQLVDTTTTIELHVEDEAVQLGEAKFFTDSFTVDGEGFSLKKGTDYAVIRILFNDDGKIQKVETLSDLPFKVIDKNTIYLKRGANLTRVSRHFGIPIQKLLDCNPKISDPNHLEAMTRLKLNCSQ